ncbi:hypothetical protein [Mesoflavibacter sp. SCSIO 43206]|uniref:hypothetical protein n=1 Tax=Mesoflavibacter sp. SCSIO 43206 TaxID=2779362 RepID=UPI001CA9A03F|nr:hypothetical protein [Mesoflavibacter sp. SCSIO 43206]UAB75135.1 hypothetical protein INR78_12195 [Mesoflavibacter sp. SCSIO 43206]
MKKNKKGHTKTNYPIKFFKNIVVEFEESQIQGFSKTVNALCENLSLEHQEALLTVKHKLKKAFYDKNINN